MTQWLEGLSRDEWLSERAKDITSTDSAALFGLSPYKSLFALWHEKKSGAPHEIAQTERMKWGLRFEKTIAEGVAEDHGLTVRHMPEYGRIEDARMGGSFDFEITGAAQGPAGELFAAHGPGLLEIKNVDSLIFRNQWTDTEMPPHIEIQVQHQMHVAGHSWAICAPMIGGNETKVFYRLKDVVVGAAIERRVNEFWASIDGDAPPLPAYPSDAAFVASLYGEVDPDATYDGREDAELMEWCADYFKGMDFEKNGAAMKETAKARILQRIGNAHRAWMPEYAISATMVKEAEIKYTRKAYRSFRINKKGDKQ